jgi:hypothetical protein
VIAPLRHRQAIAALLLAVAGPLLLSLGISARADQQETQSDTIDTLGVLHEELGYRVRLVQELDSDSGDTTINLEVDARDSERIPEVLVYWDRGHALEESLPERAVFLGPLSSTWVSSFTLPDLALPVSPPYCVYFVSLVRDGLVGSMQVEALQGSN